MSDIDGNGLIPFGLHVVVVTGRPRSAPTPEEVRAICDGFALARGLTAKEPVVPAEIVVDTNFAARATETLIDAAATTAGPARSSTRESDWLAAIDGADAVIVLVGEVKSTAVNTAIARAFESCALLVRVVVTDRVRVESERNDIRVRLLQQASEHLDEFNRVRLNPARLATIAAQQLDYWGLSGEAADAPPTARDTADWVLPYFSRADAAALEFQHRFLVRSLLIFVCAALSVAVVAAQVAFAEHDPGYVWGEVALLAALFFCYYTNLRNRLHDRWISYRFFAERLRSLYFLTLADDGSPAATAMTLTGTLDATETWIQRALREVVSKPHPPRSAEDDAPTVAKYIRRYWVIDQSNYHAARAGSLKTRDDVLIGVTVTLFVLTVVAAIFHALGVGHSKDDANGFARLVLLASIAVPATGAAIHGYSSQRQFRRHADRYERMVALLNQLASHLEGATSLAAVHKLALDVERVTREENGDWFGVMRFEDMELIT